MIKCYFIFFKQLPLNFTNILLPIYFTVRCRSDVDGGSITSLDNSLDFHSEILSVLPILLKYLYIG